MIERHQLKLNVSNVYSKSAGSRVLLVTNDSVKTEEVKQWSQLFQKLQIKYDVWDVDYQGFFDIMGEYREGKSLAKDFSNGLIVMVNMPSVDEVTPSQLLARADAIKSITENNIRFLFVGGESAQNRELITTQFLLPSAEEIQNSKLLSLDEVKEQFEGHTVSTHSVNQKISTWFFTTPKASYIESVANKISKRLKNKFPDQQFFVVHQFKPQMKHDGIVNDFDVGTIDVFQGLASNKSYFTSIAEPYSVLSYEMEYAVLLSLPIESKIDLYKLYMNANSKLTSRLENAILVDLMTEHASLKKIGNDGSLDKRMPALDFVLRNIADGLNLSFVSADEKTQERSKLFLQFLAKMIRTAEQFTRLGWWFYEPIDEDIFEIVYEKVFARIETFFETGSECKYFGWSCTEKGTRLQKEQEAIEDMFEAEYEYIRNLNIHNIDPVAAPTQILNRSFLHEIDRASDIDISEYEVMEAYMTTTVESNEAQNEEIRNKRRNLRLQEQSELHIERMD